MYRMKHPSYIVWYAEYAKWIDTNDYMHDL
jgi:hypothetical protein